MLDRLPRWRTVVAVAFGFIVGVVGTLMAVAAGLFAPVEPKRAIPEWGQFPARPLVDLLDDGRQLRLLEDFVYLDPRDRAWTAPKNCVVDGASIPRVFWTVAGGPLEGRFRNASIVHDKACMEMTDPWEQVHLMFYEACRCGGMSEYESKVLYAAVYHFGPRWELKELHEQREEIGPDGKPRTVMATRNVPDRLFSVQEPDETTREKLESLIQSTNPSLSDLKQLDPSALRADRPSGQEEL